MSDRLTSARATRIHALAAEARKADEDADRAHRRFADAVRREREREDRLSLRELADITGLSFARIHKIEQSS